MEGTFLNVVPYLKVGDCGWVVHVEGMTEEQMEDIAHGQEIVVRYMLVTVLESKVCSGQDDSNFLVVSCLKLNLENLNCNFCIEYSLLHSSPRLNVVTMEWPGQLLLMGYRIFEENNNDAVDAVNEEGNSITSISSLLRSDEIEVEVGDGAAGSKLSKGLNFASTSENLNVGDDWCEDRENGGKGNSEKNHLNPVVRLRRLDERRINAWAGVDIEEEQDDSDEGSESGGSILKQGLKFSSADAYLSFMEEDQPEVDAALQPPEAGVGEEQGNGEEVESLEKEAEEEVSPLNRGGKGSRR